MVDHQSKEVVDQLSRDLKAQPAMQLPRKIVDSIQPVFNVNPERDVKATSAQGSDAASSPFTTFSSIKETFIIGCSLSIAKDVVSDSLFSRILIDLPTGQQASLIQLRYEPLTAGQEQMVVMFPMPIKVLKGSTPVITHSTATASIDGTGTLFFFEVDPQ